MASKASVSRGGHSTSAAPPVDLLRKRLAQAEMQLREMEEEAKRVSDLQRRELSVFENDSKNHRERIELLRMEECMSRAELDEIQVGTKGYGSDFKLLASRTAKYKEAKELIERKRAECAASEASLVEAKQQLQELRSTRQVRFKSRVGSTLAAAARDAALGEFRDHSREQMRNLEIRLQHELERFSAMSTDAKDLRSLIDQLLIKQSRYEKNYRKRENEIYDKKKQMAFLIEVCNVVFEEREKLVAESKEIQQLAEEENAQYERAFDELNGVLSENERIQEQNRAKTLQLLTSLEEAKQERIGMEEMNASKQRAIHQHKKARAAAAGDDADIDDEDEDDEVGGAASQIHEFEIYFDQLAEIVGVSDIATVTDFLNRSSLQRFSLYTEVNHFNDEIHRLEEERKTLLATPHSLAQGSEEHQERSKRMKQLQAELSATRGKAEVEEGRLHIMNDLLQHLVKAVEAMFVATGCDARILREHTGSEVVMEPSSVAGLSLIDQRVEEYLVALARLESSAQTSVVASAGAAKTIFRRPDLPKKEEHVALQYVRQKGLPRSADAMAASSAVGHDENTSGLPEYALEPEEMKLVVQDRLQDPTVKRDRM